MLALSPHQRTQIARAYHAGVRPSELGREHGISTALVIMIAKRYDRVKSERRKPGPKARQQIAAPPPMQEPVAPPCAVVVLDGIKVFEEPADREYRIGASPRKTRVRLPYIEMHARWLAGGEGATKPRTRQGISG